MNFSSLVPTSFKQMSLQAPADFCAILHSETNDRGAEDATQPSCWPITAAHSHFPPDIIRAPGYRPHSL